jgi:hypothetical protein
MTHKEKAKEIVSRFEETLFGYDVFDDDWVKCINCALIAVDEIINTHLLSEKDIFGTHPVDYWNEVKQEIEKL